jgi:hypothetical protein
MSDALLLSRIEVIREKLDRVTASGAQPFGVEDHGFRRLPVAPEEDVTAFEELYGVSLPADYRTFLLRVSSGGAGPGYGMAPFDAAPTYQRADFPAEAVARPFPFVEDHLLQPDGPETERADDTAGTLVLSHEGCGYLHLLIVSGQARGQVWIDAYVSDVGLLSIAPSFSDWYERWLDHILGGGDGCWWMSS